MHPFMRTITQLARVAAAFAIACAALLPSAIGHAAQGRDVDGSLMVGDMRRTYLLHLPARYSTAHAWPLLLAYHGRGGTGHGMLGLTHLSAVADRNGFIVAYPDGYRRSWADGRGGTPADQAGIDDVAFSLALLDTLESRYAVDRGAVGATGISNGGFMVQRLACSHSERFAAIAPVASALPPALAASCALTRPIAVLAIQGTEDPLVP
jgi:polyhydroxybutyrate depolymerase